MLKTSLLIMAYQYMGTPYKWGGQDCLGLDCSGLVLKSFHDVGITLPDMTSQGIYYWMIKEKFSSQSPDADCILFFGSSTERITHIAIAMNHKYMIEAGGSGKKSLTMAREDLARVDARVRIKPISNRKDLIASIKLNY